MARRRALLTVRRHGQPVAQFYTDLYAPRRQRGGAWMADIRARRQLADGSVQIQWRC